MRKTIGVLLCFFLALTFGWSQNSNDNCENAIDISSQLFVYAEPFSCGYKGAPVDSYGSLELEMQNPTIDSLQYNSQQCIGYTDQTNDTYPDVWFKSDLHNNHYIEQSVFISYTDTLQVALYYGQCGNLFQSQCFTLSKDDSLLVQPLDFENYSHHQEDNLFIQIKTLPGHPNYVAMCFTIGLYKYDWENSFDYSRPAITILTSDYSSILDPSTPARIYPNPAQNEIIIEAKDIIQNFELLDMMGLIIVKSSPQCIKTTQDISFLTSGMYWVRIKTAKGWTASKMIVFKD